VSLLARQWRWLKWLIAIGLLGWLGYANREAMAQIAREPKSWGYLGLAIMTLLATYLITFMRWWVLVRAQQFVFPPREAIRLGFIGLVANYVTPGTVGGDLVKAILMARGQALRRTAAVATVIIDRVVGMLALFIVGSLIALSPSSALDRPELAPVRWLMWTGALVGTTSLVLMLQPWLTRSRVVRSLERIPKAGGLFRELIEGVGLYQSRPGAAWLALGLGIVCQCGLVTGFFFCARWMQQAWTPDLAEHFSFLPATFLFGAFVPVPAGMGVLEGAAVWFYEQVRPEEVSDQAAAAAGFLAAIAFRIVTTSIAALGGGFYLTARGEIARAMATDDRDPRSRSASATPKESP